MTMSASLIGSKQRVKIDAILTQIAELNDIEKLFLLLNLPDHTTTATAANSPSTSHDYAAKHHQHHHHQHQSIANGQHTTNYSHSLTSSPSSNCSSASSNSYYVARSGSTVATTSNNGLSSTAATTGSEMRRNDMEQLAAYVWIMTHLEKDENCSLPKQEVYEEYVSYCKTHNRGVEHLCVADFGKAMKQVFPGLKPRRLGQRGHSRYCYSGLRKRYKMDAPKLPPVVPRDELSRSPSPASMGGPRIAATLQPPTMFPSAIESHSSPNLFQLQHQSQMQQMLPAMQQQSQQQTQLQDSTSRYSALMPGGQSTFDMVNGQHLNHSSPYHAPQPQPQTPQLLHQQHLHLQHQAEQQQQQVMFNSYAQQQHNQQQLLNASQHQLQHSPFGQPPSASLAVQSPTTCNSYNCRPPPYAMANLQLQHHSSHQPSLVASNLNQDLFDCSTLTAAAKSAASDSQPYPMYAEDNPLLPQHHDSHSPLVDKSQKAPSHPQFSADGYTLHSNKTDSHSPNFEQTRSLHRSYSPDDDEYDHNHACRPQPMYEQRYSTTTIVSETPNNQDANLVASNTPIVKLTDEKTTQPQPMVSNPTNSASDLFGVASWGSMDERFSQYMASPCQSPPFP